MSFIGGGDWMKVMIWGWPEAVDSLRSELGWGLRRSFKCGVGSKRWTGLRGVLILEGGIWGGPGEG